MLNQQQACRLPGPQLPAAARCCWAPPFCPNPTCPTGWEVLGSGRLAPTLAACCSKLMVTHTGLPCAICASQLTRYPDYTGCILPFCSLLNGSWVGQLPVFYCLPPPCNLPRHAVTTPPALFTFMWDTGLHYIHRRPRYGLPTDAYGSSPPTTAADNGCWCHTGWPVPYARRYTGRWAET